MLRLEITGTHTRTLFLTSKLPTSDLFTTSSSNLPCDSNNKQQQQQPLISVQKMLMPCVISEHNIISDVWTLFKDQRFIWSGSENRKWCITAIVEFWWCFTSSTLKKHSTGRTPSAKIPSVQEFQENATEIIYLLHFLSFPKAQRNNLEEMQRASKLVLPPWNIGFLRNFQFIRKSSDCGLAEIIPWPSKLNP